MTEVPLKVCGRHKLPHLPQRPPCPPLVQEIRGGGRLSCSLPCEPCIPQPCDMGPDCFSTFSRKNFLLILLYLFYLFFEKKKKSRQKHRKPLCRNGFQMFTFSFSVHFLQTNATLASTL